MTALPATAESIAVSVSVRELKHALKLAKPFTYRRSSIMALQHVKLDGFGIHATNMGAYASIPCNLYGLEDCLVKPADLLAALKGLSVRDSVTLQLQGSSLIVNGCSLPTFDVDDWPDFPELDGSAMVREVPAGLADAIRDVATHASGDDSRPVLTGVRVVGKGNRLEVLATDSYRLAGMSLEASAEACDGIDTLIPVDAGKYVRHLTDIVCWEQDVRYVRMDCVDGARYFLRKIEGTFPSWTQLVPTSEYVVDLAPIGPGLLDTLDRCSKLSKRNPARLTFDPRGSFNVELRQVDGPELDATWNFDWADERFAIGVRPEHLADAIRFVGADMRFGMTSPLRPMILGTPDAAVAGAFRFALVMPVRLPE